VFEDFLVELMQDIRGNGIMDVTMRKTMPERLKNTTNSSFHTLGSEDRVGFSRGSGLIDGVHCPSLCPSSVFLEF